MVMGEMSQKNMPLRPCAVDCSTRVGAHSVKPESVVEEKKVAKEYTPLRWQGEGLPTSCLYTMEYLRKMYAGKEISPDMLIPCPKDYSSYWWCVYIIWGKNQEKGCLVCKGHKECLFDLVTSPEMLAPLCEESISGEAKVRIPPQNSSSMRGSDTVISDQCNSQSSCCADKQLT